jgi:hypothetical protein
MVGINTLESRVARPSRSSWNAWILRLICLEYASIAFFD